MKVFTLNVTGGNVVGRNDKPRTVSGEIRIDVNSNDETGSHPSFNTDQEELIFRMLVDLAKDLTSRLDRCYPPTGRRPSNFLESHALEALRIEPTWTVNMYAAYNDLDTTTTEALRAFLKDHLLPHQVERNKS
jgi:hypothetical protein